MRCRNASVTIHYESCPEYGGSWEGARNGRIAGPGKKKRGAGGSYARERGVGTPTLEYSTQGVTNVTKRRKSFRFSLSVKPLVTYG